MMQFEEDIDACMCTQKCPTLYDPMDCSPPGSSVHEVSRQEYWNGFPFPSPGNVPDSGLKPASLVLPELSVTFFTS